MYTTMQNAQTIEQAAGRRLSPRDLAKTRVRHLRRKPNYWLARKQQHVV